jgi:hypothetical protein
MFMLKEWMELVDYRITEGSDYGWGCYGGDAFSLDSWNGDQEGHSFSVIFDTVTQVVYELQAHDLAQGRAYRLINPQYRAAFDEEAGKRGVSFSDAWDGVDYVDLEVKDDFFQKCLAIKAGEEYDTRVIVPVDFSDEDLLRYMKLAHDRDITFNELVVEALSKAIELHKINPQGFGQMDID